MFHVKHLAAARTCLSARSCARRRSGLGRGRRCRFLASLQPSRLRRVASVVSGGSLRHVRPLRHHRANGASLNVAGGHSPHALGCRSAKPHCPLARPRRESPRRLLSAESGSSGLQSGPPTISVSPTTRGVRRSVAHAGPDDDPGRPTGAVRPALPARRSGALGPRLESHRVEPLRPRTARVLLGPRHRRRRTCQPAPARDSVSPEPIGRDSRARSRARQRVRARGPAERSGSRDRPSGRTTPPVPTTTRRERRTGPDVPRETFRAAHQRGRCSGFPTRRGNRSAERLDLLQHHERRLAHDPGLGQPQTRGRPAAPPASGLESPPGGSLTLSRPPTATKRAPALRGDRRRRRIPGRPPAGRTPAAPGLARPVSARSQIAVTLESQPSRAAASSIHSDRAVAGVEERRLGPRAIRAPAASPGTPPPLPRSRNVDRRRSPSASAQAWVWSRWASSGPGPIRPRSCAPCEQPEQPAPLVHAQLRRITT